MAKPKRKVFYQLIDHSGDYVEELKTLKKTLRKARYIPEFTILKITETTKSSYLTIETLPILIDSVNGITFPCGKSKRHVIKMKHLRRYLYKD